MLGLWSWFMWLSQFKVAILTFGIPTINSIPRYDFQNTLARIDAISTCFIINHLNICHQFQMNFTVFWKLIFDTRQIALANTIRRKNEMSRKCFKLLSLASSFFFFSFCKKFCQQMFVSYLIFFYDLEDLVFESLKIED